MAGKRHAVAVLTGDAALNRKLRRLTSQQAKEAIRQSARTALKPTVLKAAKRFTPRSTNRNVWGRWNRVTRNKHLRDSFTVRALRRSKRSVGARVTTRDGWFEGKTFYGGFLEWGHYWGKRGTANRKWIRPVGMVTQAVKAKGDAAVRLYRSLIRDYIYRATRSR